jgi:hypothetical protein
MTMFQNLHRSMAQGETLKIGCTACPHVATLTRGEAIARFTASRWSSTQGG